MANLLIRVSQLPEVAQVSGTETFMVIQGGVSKKVQLNNLFNGMKSNKDFVFDVQTNEFIIKNDGENLVNVIGNGINKVGIKTNNPLQALHVNGSIQIGIPASTVVNNPQGNHLTTSSGVLISPYEVIDGSVSSNIDSSNDTTLVSCRGGDKSFTLSSGINGQNKTIIFFYQEDNSKATITPNASLGFSNVVMSSLGATINLKYINGRWVITSSIGAQINA